MAVDYVLWYYTPSMAAAAIFAAIFGLLTGVHIFRLIKSRTWFCIPIIVGGIFETIGYIARAVAHDNKQSTTIYAIQSVLILLGPILFAASDYMILGRVIRAMEGEKWCIVSVRWLTKIFVGGDITCFLIQGSGGGILSQATTQKDVDLGEHIILGGLILQIAVFVVFIVVAFLYHIRVRPHLRNMSRAATLPWQRYLLMLYAVSLLILVRNVFRVIEYAMGSGGYLLTHEWTLYVFDACLMTVVMGVSLAWYRSDLKPSPSRTLGSAGGGVQELQLK